MRLLFIFIMVITFVFHGCATAPPPAKPGKPPPASGKQPKPYKVLGKWYQPISDAQGFTQHGKASWYGKKFHGRKTANGETYNMYGVSAAHKTLPLGTFVRVHNLENNRQLDVRINDRGPFVRGRIIDLSYAAAKRLGVVGPGTAEVQIVALGNPVVTKKSASEKRVYTPVDYNKGNFTFQVGAFRDYSNAERLKQGLEKKYKNAHIMTIDSGEGVFHRVRVGRFSTLQQAQENIKRLIDDGFEDPYLVAE
jgi:rare lipoprotein A